MAEYLALPEAALRDIETFGPLHDVGKIGIRDGILMKPGPLTDDEWAVCREHAIIGERILRPLKPSREALGMVRNHHESWDGTGYPDGLAGEMIPLLARVVQVADCYDAMVAERPHRRSISDEEVRVEFIMNRGRRYDPLAVDALLAVLDESRTPEPAYAGGTIDQRALV
jgi:HD-GYP domain-containing protein (c-di-GMP phosphodiesterase class II)